MRIPLLPEWILTGNSPAFYDSESLTAIQQTARLYGAVRELQQAFNDFTTNIESADAEFTANINSVVGEMAEQLDEIQATVVAVCTDYMRAAIESGELAVNLDVVYQPETEALTIELLKGGPANNG